MYLNQRLVNKRIYVIYIAVFAFTLVLAGRLFYLQVYKHEDLTNKAERQQRRPISLAEKRGLITDRNGNNLAIDNQSISLYAYPKEYAQAEEIFKEKKDLYEKYLTEVHKELRKELLKNKIKIIEIDYRVKHKYSLWPPQQ